VQIRFVLENKRKQKIRLGITEDQLETEISLRPNKKTALFIHFKPCLDIIFTTEQRSNKEVRHMKY